MTKLVTFVVLVCSFSAFAGPSKKATFKDDKEMLESLSRSKNYPWGTEVGDLAFEKGVRIAEVNKLKFCRYITGGEGFPFDPVLISEGKIISRGLGAGMRNSICVTGLNGGAESRYNFRYDLGVRLELISETGQRMTESQKEGKVVPAELQASASESNELEYGTRNSAALATEKEKAFLNKLANSAKAANPYYRFANYYNSIRQELRAHGYELCSKRLRHYKTGQNLDQLPKLEVYDVTAREGKDVKISKEICFLDPVTKAVRRLEVETKTSMSIGLTENY